MNSIKKLYYNGTEGRTRTDTVLPPSDFESDASTNFATPACVGKVQYTKSYMAIKH